MIAGALTLGVLISFIQYAQRFFRPIQDLSEKFNILQAAMAASERIFGLARRAGDDRFAGKDARAACAARRNRIPQRVVRLSRRRDSEGRRLGAARCFLPRGPGQTLAIVGHTGAGKTTIIQLLLRFYDIQRGQILLDGVDIREMDLQDLRRDVRHRAAGSIPFHRHARIEREARDAKTSAGPPRNGALREVGLGPFLDSLPQGLDTPVTERGSTLSVGQRQLVSFARALAHNPKFLILDEATSSVDTKTELLIREALDRLLEGRTAMVIAHRLSTIQHADRILVFHKGRLREQGSHQELLGAARNLLPPVPASVQRAGV